MSSQCQYCKRSFVKESTLAHHICERKRRFQQEREVGVQWGYRAYLTFYATTQNNQRSKNYSDFVDSAYYTAFVRFGRHCHSVHCINFENYTTWLLKNNKKLDQWCSDQLYNQWLCDYISKENVQDALERTMQTMINYMTENQEFRNGYVDYFRLVNENRICYHITTGRISPWAVYNCQTGMEFLGRLNNDQVAMIIDFINPDFWKIKFARYPEDVKFVNTILKTAGL